jgi:hypothetical protein
MHADYSLSRDPDGTSRLDVVETFVAEFPLFDQNRGIVRAIPDRYLDIPQETVVVSVTDGTGAALPFETVSTREFLELALGTDNYVQGRQTYVISYTQRHVVGAFADTASDEFYQDVNGIGHDQPFGRVSATVRVSPELTDSLSGLTGCASGVAGSDSACDVTLGTDSDGSSVFTASVDDLGPRETLTVNVGFAPDTFVQGIPTEFTPDDEQIAFTEPPAWYLALSIGQLVAVVGVVIAAITVRIRSSRTSRSGIIIPQYSVPKDLNVMVAAHLAGRPRTAVPAQLISLAVRKNLRILDYPVTASDSEYTLQFLTTDGADPLEQQLLAALFGPTPEAGPCESSSRTTQPSARRSMPCRRPPSDSSRPSVTGARAAPSAACCPESRSCWSSSPSASFSAASPQARSRSFRSSEFSPPSSASSSRSAPSGSPHRSRPPGRPGTTTSSA